MLQGKWCWISKTIFWSKKWVSFSGNNNNNNNSACLKAYAAKHLFFYFWHISNIGLVLICLNMWSHSLLFCKNVLQNTANSVYMLNCEYHMSAEKLLHASLHSWQGTFIFCQQSFVGARNFEAQNHHKK